MQENIEHDICITSYAINIKLFLLIHSLHHKLKTKTRILIYSDGTFKIYRTHAQHYSIIFLQATKLGETFIITYDKEAIIKLNKKTISGIHHSLNLKN